MTTVQYYTAASLDGFIADQENSLDWLYAVPQDDGESTWDDFFVGVGPMAMGATTYQWAFGQHDYGDNPGQWREYYDDRPCWVFTHRELPAIPGIDIRFVSGDVRPVYDEMVATRPGTCGWSVSGQRLNVVLDVRRQAGAEPASSK